MEFKYREFQINFDSVRHMDFYLPTGDLDKNGQPIANAMNSTVELVTGVLVVDAPNNKSGKEDLAMFPSLQSKKHSFVFYDKSSIQKGVYTRDSFYFKLDPFSFNGLDNYEKEALRFKGEMFAAGIFEPLKETIYVRDEDKSFGFIHPTPAKGYPTYFKKGNYTGQLDLSNKGFLGKGKVDFTLIKAGALHRANGGYLLLDAHKLLSQPFAWEGLKRALRTRRIRLDSLGQVYSLVSTTSLEPEAIPLHVKIVLFGERLWYHLLFAYDPDFGELFKVAVDFEDEVARTPENHQLLARLIATIARRNAFAPLDRSAVVRLIEHRAREIEDSERVSTHMQGLVDLMTEADFAARRAGAATIDPGHIAHVIGASRLVIGIVISVGVVIGIGAAVIKKILAGDVGAQQVMIYRFPAVIGFGQVRTAFADPGVQGKISVLKIIKPELSSWAWRGIW